MSLRKLCLFHLLPLLGWVPHCKALIIGTVCVSYSVSAALVLSTSKAGTVSFDLAFSPMSCSNRCSGNMLNDDQEQSNDE